MSVDTEGLDAESDAAPRRVIFPALDGYRGLAAMLVLLAHVALFSGLLRRNPTLAPYLARADVGVSIFFLLSGFLLYRPFVAARLANQPRPAVGPYLRRRALRILPGYWFALTVVAFVLRAPGFERGHSILAHYLLIHVYDTRPIAPDRFQITGGPVQQSWTLATELSFYVFLPMWAWLLARRERTPRRQLTVELVGLAALWGGAIGIKLIGLAVRIDDSHYGLYGAWLPFRLDEFALGMTMAVASAWIAHQDIVLPTWLRGTGTTVVCWLMAALLFWVTCTRLRMPITPLFTARKAFVVRFFYSFTALFLLLPAVFGRSEGGPVKWLFQNRVMVWIGLISYGIYIWHEAWQDKYLEWFNAQAFNSSFWAMLGVTLVLSIASGAFSWYVVERTAMLFKHGLRSR